VRGSKRLRQVVVVGSIGLLGAAGSGAMRAKPAVAAGIGAGEQRAIWRTGAGQVTLLPHSETLAALGLELQTLRQTAVSERFPQIESSFAIDDRSASSSLAFTTGPGGGFDLLLGGRLQTSGEMLLGLPDGTRLAVGNLAFRLQGSGGGVIDTLNTNQEIFYLTSGLLQFKRADQRFEWVGLDLYLNKAWAVSAGIPGAAETPIATVVIEAAALPAPELAAELAALPAGESAQQAAPRGGIGPDVITGEVDTPVSDGQVGAINAYAIGTVSCNAGDVPLEWFASTNHHPVISQNLFRLKDGRFEQIGQSWLKHGFTALQENACFNDCQATAGNHLGVHCSDPYWGGLNDNQTGLGPKFEVNAFTGFFLYPFTGQGQTGDAIYKRLQVHTADVDPNQNGGALYYAEGEYIMPDDAAAGNQFNNASYRRVTFTNNPPTYTLNVTDTTMRQQTAILAWKANDPQVTIITISVPGDGRLQLGYKVTNLGGGAYHYEYALYNMNSWRSVRSFSVPLPLGVSPTNIGFHDVDYHSGEPFDGSDWNASIAGGSITWYTVSLTENPNANALRWGTLYNFRFDASSPPTLATATLGLFNLRPLTSGPANGGSSLLRMIDASGSTASSVAAATMGPS